ncbi:MAG: AAA family ATPase [archaeon]
MGFRDRLEEMLTNVSSIEAIQFVVDGYSQKRSDFSVWAAEELVGRGMSDFRLYKILAKNHFQQGEFNRGFENLELAIDNNPEDAESYFLRGLGKAQVYRHQTKSKNSEEILSDIKDNFVLAVKHDLSFYRNVLDYLNCQTDLDTPGADIPSTTEVGLVATKTFKEVGGKFDSDLLLSTFGALDIDFIDDFKFLQWFYEQAKVLEEPDFITDELKAKLVLHNYNDIEYLINTFSGELFKNCWFPDEKKQKLMLNKIWNHNNKAVQTNPVFNYRLAEFIWIDGNLLNTNANFASICIRNAIENEYYNKEAAEAMLHRIYCHRIIAAEDERVSQIARREYREFCAKNGIVALDKIEEHLDPDDLEEDTINEMLPALLGPTPDSVTDFSLRNMILNIKHELDTRIIGQEEPSRALSEAIGNHVYRVREILLGHQPQTDHSNLLLIGSTATGKTLSAKVALEFALKEFKLPAINFDASTITEHGYVGADAEDCLQLLYLESGKNLKATECGIIFLDEFDKKNSQGNTGSRDVSGSGAMHSLLKILEGHKTLVTIGQHPDKEDVIIDTSNILFIAMGAFQGSTNQYSLDSAIKQIRKQKLGIGIKSEKIDPLLLSDRILLPEALHMFGIIPQVSGRLPYKIRFNELTEQNLYEILQNDLRINNLERIPVFRNRYRKIFDRDLVVQKDAMQEIAKYAYELKLGARGLNEICDLVIGNLIRQELFEKEINDASKRVITPQYVRKTLENKRQEQNEDKKRGLGFSS